MLAAQEIWQSNTTIAGYDSICIERKTKRGGGVGFFVKTGHDFKLHKRYIDKNVEFITIEIRNKRYTSVYLPPNNNVTEGLKTLEMNLDKNLKNYVLGDFNIDLNLDSYFSSEASPTEKLHDFNRNLLLYPVIKHPTRITKKSATIIDNIMTNEREKVTVGIFTCEVADHLSPFIILHDKEKGKKAIKNTQKKSITARNTKQENLDNLKIELSQTNWEAVRKENDTSKKTEIFNATFSKLFDKHCPVQTVKFNNKIHSEKEWMTKGLLQSRNKKMKLHSRWIQTKNPKHHEKYKEYLSIFEKVKKQAISDHYKELYQNNYKDSRKMWQITNNILQRKQKQQGPEVKFLENNGKKITSSKEIANAFNQHFVSIGQKLAEKFEKNNNFLHHMPEANKANFTFKVITKKDFFQTVKSLKNKKSSGYDHISNKLIKFLRNELCEPIKNIINSSLCNSKVPSDWKIAKVIPLHKGGDMADMNNFRPISLLSALSKIMEKTVHQQLYSFLENKLLCNNQFGFRKKCETTQAVTNYLKNIQENDDKKYHISIFIDIKKAFDSVNHEFLLKKLEILGVRGPANNWFRDYLRNRKQSTIFRNDKSEEQPLNCGVPQGSILGPLLFLVYINDMPGVTRLLTTLFADDTTYQNSSNSIHELEKETNEELNKIAVWFEDNNLTLHPKKTRYILFNAKPTETVNINLQGQEILRVGENQTEKSFKFLGIWIDEQLNWKEHISKTVAKTRRLTYTLIKLKRYLATEHVALIYKGLIKPIYEYGISIWGHKMTREIKMSHKKIIRVLNSVPKHTHVEPLLKDLNILQLHDLYTIKTLALLNKIRTGEAPDIIKGYLQWNQKDTRRWYQVRTWCNISKISRKLPGAAQAKTWNDHFNEVNHQELDLYPTKKLSRKWKDEKIATYYRICDMKKCYSCRMTAEYQAKKMKEREEKREEIRAKKYETQKRINNMIYGY